jgi:hypothetical protein
MMKKHILLLFVLALTLSNSSHAEDLHEKLKETSPKALNGLEGLRKLAHKVINRKTRIVEGDASSFLDRFSESDSEKLDRLFEMVCELNSEIVALKNSCEDCFQKGRKLILVAADTHETPVLFERETVLTFPEPVFKIRALNKKYYECAIDGSNVMIRAIALDSPKATLIIRYGEKGEHTCVVVVSPSDKAPFLYRLVVDEKKSGHKEIAELLIKAGSTN